MATIAVVDDREPDRQFLAAVLGHAGQVVLEYADGLDAISGIAAQKPDLVITDVVMPSVDGFELVRQVRDLPGTRNIPVIFYTSAYDDGAVRTLVDACKPALILRKGSNSKSIVQAVSQLLRQPLQKVESLRQDFAEIHLELVTTMLHQKLSELERANEELRQTNQDLRESMESLQQFIYSAAHDLQEPVRNIVNSTEMLFTEHDEQIDGCAKIYFQECLTSGHRLHQMMTGLLTYLTVLEGVSDPTGPSDGNEVAQSVLEYLGTAISDSRAAVHVGALPTLAVSKRHLRLLFEHLIDNALKYRSERTPEINVFSHSKAGMATIHVADNGMGFNQASAEDVFKLFRRLHHPSQYQGVGIGLALCSRIVRHYKGRIWAEPDIGHGATFSFALPLYAEAAYISKS